MRRCCPPGHGCNHPSGHERCALEVCAAGTDREPEATGALERWGALLLVSAERPGSREERFRRRAYERSRDRALILLALRSDLWPTERRAPARPRRTRRRSGYRLTPEAL